VGKARLPAGRILDHGDRLTYLLEWKDLAERERVWAGFMSDPDWLKARAESEKNGPIVANITSSILAPTAFSKLR